MTDYVLVHGAFRGGWAWDRVAPKLRAAGHRVYTPDLTAADATLGSYIGQLVELVGAADLDDVVLVGHSQGGFIAKAASEPLAARLSCLMYLDAPVPRDGETGFDFRPSGTAPPDVETGDVIEARPVDVGPGMSAADAAWINARLIGQPVAPSMEPVALSEPAALALPERYAFFSGTPEWFPCAVTRARLDDAGISYALIDGPHDGIVTHAAEVAAYLLAAV